MTINKYRLPLNRAEKRMKMRDWLEMKIGDPSYPDLVWYNEKEQMFRIPWKHGGRHGWREKEDARLFLEWSEHTGASPRDVKQHKANFRCALNSLRDVKELQHLNKQKGDGAYKVYQLLPKVSKKKNARWIKKRKPSSLSPKESLAHNQHKNVNVSTCSFAPARYPICDSDMIEDNLHSFGTSPFVDWITQEGETGAYNYIPISSCATKPNKFYSFIQPSTSFGSHSPGGNMDDHIVEVGSENNHLNESMHPHTSADYFTQPSASLDTCPYACPLPHASSCGDLNSSTYSTECGESFLMTGESQGIHPGSFAFENYRDGSSDNFEPCLSTDSNTDGVMYDKMALLPSTVSHQEQYEQYSIPFHYDDAKDKVPEPELHTLWTNDDTSPYHVTTTSRTNDYSAEISGYDPVEANLSPFQISDFSSHSLSRCCEELAGASNISSTGIMLPTVSTLLSPLRSENTAWPRQDVVT